MKSFIHARAWQSEKPRGAFNWPKKKPGYVALAYQYRDKPVVLKIPKPTDDFVADAIPATVSPAATVETMGSQTSSRKASEYLSDDSWVTAIRNSFLGNFQDVDDEMKGRADELLTRLLYNLDSHINKKVEQSKHHHFTLEWTRNNLAQFAAVVSLAGQVHNEPLSLGLTDCLLKHPTFVDAFLRVDENDKDKEQELSNAEGCYLHYDMKNAKWIRSGKVAGTSSDPKGILDRNDEHREKARNGGNGSKLYTEYPAKDSSRAKIGRENNVRPYPWKAYFEDLALFCGVGFVRSEAVVKNLMLDCGAGETDDTATGIFSWDQHTIDALNQWEKEGVTTLKDKQLHMIAYLLELGYDLMLDAEWNVSTMPGYEKFGLVNHKKK